MRPKAATLLSRSGLVTARKNCQVTLMARHLSTPATASEGTWGQGTVEGRLTCLSVRCLSSYLIFSASSSDKQAADRSPRRFTGARSV
jgi:hypothetical protein